MRLTGESTVKRLINAVFTVSRPCRQAGDGIGRPIPKRHEDRGLQRLKNCDGVSACSVKWGCMCLTGRLKENVKFL